MKFDARTRLIYEVARKRANGVSIRGIARSLGIARPTVRRILRQLEERRALGDELAPQTGPTRAPRPSKLDAYAEVIDELIRRYPDSRATRLHEELQARGFDGGYTIVRERLKELRPKPGRRVYMVVETEPGQQGQWDWSPYSLANKTPVYAFSSVLAFSRHQYVHFCSDMRQPTLLEEVKSSFAYHGGLAIEYVVDSMPGIVDRWELGRPVLNLRAVDFAAYYGISLHVAPRGDGPYKGKVERPFRFIEESLLNARTFHTLAELNETCARWLADRCNGRKHQRTGRRPIDALADEPLRPLPAHPYDARDLAHRLVDSYGYIRFDGNFYRAVGGDVGQWVYIRASADEVTIVGGAATILACYERGPKNARLYIPPPARHKRPRRRPSSELLACFEAWGSRAHRFAQCVRQRKRHASVELSHLLDLRTTWSAEDILRAIEHASRFDNES
ncbi:MAG: IS21 family transposase [Proteobacteria bacterium]|nr:IS21 family transposase [Pseudomonadota bacterium]